MKRVLITGASGGLGFAIAKKIASECKKDCVILLHYNKSKKKTEENAKYLETTFGCKTEILSSDFCNLKETEKLCDLIISKHGGVDVLVNNAAIVVDASLEERTPEIFEKTLRCNLVSPFILSKKLGTIMNQSGGGRIVNISSTNGIDYNSPYSMDYDASKAGLISLTKNLAMLLSNVNVKCIAPHWMDTEMNADLEKEFLEEEADKTLQGRFAKPEEVAELVWFLLNDKSLYLTGQTFSFGSYKY